jgi:DNA topoisomerase-3
VHEFESTFQGKQVFMRVTSVVGHVFSVDFPPEYQDWESTDPASLFRAPIVRTAEKGGIVRHLQTEARGAEYLVLWLDCDREGENICFEVIDCVESKMAHIGGQQIFRAFFSAIGPTDIRAAMDTLGEPNENESLAVDARQEMDLKVGVAFSRFQTLFFKGKYGDLDARLISYGPCQTPTLGFCVDRHDAIMSFNPEDWWTIDLSVRHADSGIVVGLEWERGRLFDEGAVRTMAQVQSINSTVYPQYILLTVRTMSQLVRSTDSATGAGQDGEDPPAQRLLVKSVVEKEGRRGRPLPMNTVEMLKSASKGLGMGPHQAMKIAERLYLSGFISYPRTESSKYPASFDVKVLVLPY